MKFAIAALVATSAAIHVQNVEAQNGDFCGAKAVVGMPPASLAKQCSQDRW